MVVVRGRGLMVFICLYRLHRQQAGKLVYIHNKLDMRPPVCETLGLRHQTVKLQPGDTNNIFSHQLLRSFENDWVRAHWARLVSARFRFTLKVAHHSQKIAF